MTRLLRRAGALALVLLALPACDSTSPDSPNVPPSALVGTWTLRESTDETFLTVSEAQVLVDRSGPVTGTLQLTGAQTATLRYMSVDTNYGEVRLFSYDPSGPTPATRVDMRLSQNGYSDLYVSAQNGSYSQYNSYGNTSPYTYADGRLTVHTTTFQASDGTAVTLAAGTVSYPTTQIAAGTRTLARRTMTPFEGAFVGTTVVRYIFETGGVYRAERDAPPNRTLSVAGTWEAAGTRLRLSTTVAQRYTETETFQYEVAGGTLRLGVTDSSCRQNTGCLGFQEQNLGLRPGTLTAIETTTTSTFGQAPQAARAAAPQAVTPEAAARREAVLWPRALAAAAL